MNIYLFFLSYSEKFIMHLKDYHNLTKCAITQTSKTPISQLFSKLRENLEVQEGYIQKTKFPIFFIN